MKKNTLFCDIMAGFFSSGKKENNTQTQHGSGLSILAKGVCIKGDIICEGDIRIEGIVDGNVYCHGRVVVGTLGSIIGKLDSNLATIEGKVEGLIVVRDTLQLSETAQVHGDVITGKMIVLSGAVFTGSCKMGQEALDIIAKEYPQTNAPK